MAETEVKEEEQSFNVLLPKSMHRALRQAALDRDKSAKDIIIAALAAELQREEAKP